jgi:hypothetical protein
MLYLVLVRWLCIWQKCVGTGIGSQSHPGELMNDLTCWTGGHVNCLSAQPSDKPYASSQQPSY